MRSVEHKNFQLSMNIEISRIDRTTFTRVEMVMKLLFACWTSCLGLLHFKGLFALYSHDHLPIFQNCEGLWPDQHAQGDA